MGVTVSDNGDYASVGQALARLNPTPSDRGRREAQSSSFIHLVDLVLCSLRPLIVPCPADTDEPNDEGRRHAPPAPLAVVSRDRQDAARPGGPSPGADAAAPPAGVGRAVARISRTAGLGARRAAGLDTARRRTRSFAHLHRGVGEPDVRLRDLDGPELGLGAAAGGADAGRGGRRTRTSGVERPDGPRTVRRRGVVRLGLVYGRLRLDRGRVGHPAPAGGSGCGRRFAAAGRFDGRDPRPALARLQRSGLVLDLDRARRHPGPRADVRTGSVRPRRRVTRSRASARRGRFDGRTSRPAVSRADRRRRPDRRSRGGLRLRAARR